MRRGRSSLTLHLSLLSLLVSVVGSAPTVRAQGFIIPEIGARKNSMGAAIGRPDDLSAIYHNPAALAWMRGTRIGMSFGAAFLGTRIRLAPWKGSDKFIKDPVDADGYYPKEAPNIFAPIPFLGASTNLWSDKVVGAFGVYVPNAAGATFGRDQPSRYHVIDGYIISAYFTAAVAYHPFDCLSFGVAVSGAYIRVERRSFLFPVLDGKDLSSIFGSKTEVELIGDDFKPAFSFGMQAWPLDTLSIGFLFLTPPLPDVTISGPLRLKLGEDADPFWNKKALTENTHATELGAPWVLALGANWDATPWLEIGAEFRYYINYHIHDQVTKITNDDSVLKTFLPNGQLVTPKNLHDTFHVGGGVLIRPPLPLDLEVMSGFHYESSSTPDNTVEVSVPSFDLLGIHAGVRWHFAKRYAFTIAYSHYWYFERTTKDSLTDPPTNFTGNGFTNQVTAVFEVSLDRGLGVASAPKGPKLPRACPDRSCEAKKR